MIDQEGRPRPTVSSVTLRLVVPGCVRKQAEQASEQFLPWFLPWFPSRMDCAVYKCKPHKPFPPGLLLAKVFFTAVESRLRRRDRVALLSPMVGRDLYRVAEALADLNDLDWHEIGFVKC